VQTWYYRMMNHPDEWEKFRYIDSINVYSSVIEELENCTTRHL